MRTYTIVVDEVPDETLPGGAPQFSGVIIEGESPEGCVRQGCEAITLHLRDLTLAQQEERDSPQAGTGEERAGSAGLADEEAADALRRAGAALDTVEADLLAELGRRQDPQTRADLHRAHIALLKARTALSGAGRTRGPAGTGQGQPARAEQGAHEPSRAGR